MGRPAANHRASRRRPSPEKDRHSSARDVLWPAAAVLVLLALLAWSYRGVLLGLIQGWRRNEDYSAGQLVPFVAAFLVWRDRAALRQIPLVPCWWGGIVLLTAAVLVRTFGYLFMFWTVLDYSLVLTVAGLVLLVAGRPAFRRVVWILLFLFLMFPLPGNIHNLISGPLQGLATAGSVFLLETAGIHVGHQGNVVLLNDSTSVAVAEACSGLRMLTAFMIVAAFIAYMVQRPRWQKTVLLLSSIPVAVVCNILRISLTAVLMLYVSAAWAEKFFHDFAGLVMMPAAVFLLFGELWLLRRLTLEESKPPPREIVARSKSGRLTAKTLRNGAGPGFPEP